MGGEASRQWKEEEGKRERGVSGTKATWLCFLVRSLVLFLLSGAFMGRLVCGGWRATLSGALLSSQLAAGLGRTFSVGIYQPLE